MRRPVSAYRPRLQRLGGAHGRPQTALQLRQSSGDAWLPPVTLPLTEARPQAVLAILGDTTLRLVHDDGRELEVAQGGTPNGQTGDLAIGGALADGAPAAQPGTARLSMAVVYGKVPPAGEIEALMRQAAEHLAPESTAAALAIPAGETTPVDLAALLVDKGQGADLVETLVIDGAIDVTLTGGTGIELTPGAVGVAVLDILYRNRNPRPATAVLRLTVTGTASALLWPNGYQYRRDVTIDGVLDAPADTLANFPVALTLAGSWLKPEGSGGRLKSGFDVRLETLDGTLLHSVAVAHDPVAGTARIVFNRPALLSDRKQIVSVYYGKAGVESPSQLEQAIGAMPGMLVAVFGGTGNLLVSGSRGLTTYLSADEVPGLLGRAWDFDGTEDQILVAGIVAAGLAGCSVVQLVKSDAIDGERGWFGIGDLATVNTPEVSLRDDAVGFQSGAVNVINGMLRWNGEIWRTEGPAGSVTTAWRAISYGAATGVKPRLVLNGSVVTPAYNDVPAAPGKAGVSGTLQAFAAPGPIVTLGSGPDSAAFGKYAGLVEMLMVRPFLPSLAWEVLEHRLWTDAGLVTVGDEYEVADTPPAPLLAATGESISLETDQDVAVLANDVGDQLVIVAASAPAHGTAVIAGRAVTLSKAPGDSYAGADSSSYTIRDSRGQEVTGTISVTWVAPAPPVPDLPPPLRTVPVSNATQLAAAIGSAMPGDHIVLASTTFAGDRTLPAVPGSLAAKPIVLRADTLLGAVLNGNITIPGNDWILYGLTMADTRRIDVSGNRCRVSRTKLKYSGGPGIRVRADARSFRADRCEIDGSLVLATAIGWYGIRIDDPNADDVNHLVEYVYFHDCVQFTGDGDDNSAIGIGTNKAFEDKRTGVVVDHCRFEDWRGDTETVSYKSSYAAVRFSTFDNCQGPCIRHGSHNELRSCWLKNINNARIYNDHHLVIGNGGPTNGSVIQISSGTCTSADWNADTNQAGKIHPACTDSLFIGNRAKLTVGGGSAAGAAALRNRIEEHTGAITCGGAADQTGTLGACGASPLPKSQDYVPAVELLASQVGPAS